MKNLNILYDLQEVPILQIPNILYPYTGGQIFQELKFPTLKTNNSPTVTVSIHFPTHVTTICSENAHVWLMFINKNMFTLFVGRNYPLKGHSLYVAFLLHQLTTDEVPCNVFYRNIRCVNLWTHFTFTSIWIKLKNDLLSAYMVLSYHCTIVFTLSCRLTLFSGKNLTFRIW
jgi:hypothetical protein